jgi:hypothetical protein
MKTTTKLISILLLIMLTQSCTKNGGGCYTPQSYYIPLNAAQLNQTPYFTKPAFDTISFASDKGDTLTFVKTKTDTTWYEEQGNGNPDCGYDRVFSQTLRNTYTTIKGNGSFEVKHVKKGLQIFDFIQFRFNQINFSTHDWVIGDKSNPAFIDNINLGNRSYNNLTKIVKSNSTEDIAYTFMNVNFGIFYVEDLIEKTQWFILNK